MQSPNPAPGTPAAPPPSPPPRKDRFSALDTLALVRELRALPRVWFDKASQLADGRLLLSLKVQPEGRWEWLIEPGVFSVLRPHQTLLPEEPGGFSTTLRRHLQGAPLLGAEQPGGERYLEVAFGQGVGEESALLAVELFGQGNVLLVRRGRIIALLHSRVWAKRTLRPGSAYVRPPARRDPFALSAGAILETLEASNADRVSTLASRLGLGGPVAEEILARAEMDPKTPAREEAEELADRLARELPRLKDEIGERPAGYLYRERATGTLLDVSPYSSRKLRGIATLQEERRGRFSEAAWEYYSSLPAVTAERAGARPSPEAEDPRQGLLRQAAQQEEAIARLAQEVRQLREAADRLLAQHPIAEQRLAEAAPAEGSRTFELDGATYKVPEGSTVREAAQARYEEAKRAQSRLEGARSALEVTRQKLHASEASALPRERTPAPQAYSRSRHFWFERAPRFLVTGSGLVAVAGRDARSNDAVVKRYLRPQDLYFHADLHGAPSVVVKRGTETAALPEGELRLVGQWALCLSRAWRAGLATADAFWVTGEQVSKSAAAGEYVARGSWMIHGTRHALRDLPLRLTLGRVRYEGELILETAPGEVFASPGSQALWDLEPADERGREEAERGLSQSLGISREALQALLPPGGFIARRVGGNAA